MTDTRSGPSTSPEGPSGRCEWCDMPGHYPADCAYLNQPNDPVGRGLFLVELLHVLAELRHTATITYANAYLLAVGTDAARTQHAKRAAADEHLAAELAAARVAGYRHMIEGTSHETS